MRRRPPPRWLLGAAALLGLLCVGGLLSPAARQSSSSLSRHDEQTAAAATGVVYETLGLRGAQARTMQVTGSASNRTLVLYVYHESSEHYMENLRFFTKVCPSCGRSSRVMCKRVGPR